jgi:leader peptidase (prepilin peptidase)/N-methyltransferase
MRSHTIESFRRLLSGASWPKAIPWIAGAAAALASFVSAPGLVGFLGAGLAVVAVTIAVIDWRHFIIPDWLNATGLVLAFIHAAARDPDAVLSAVALAAVRGVALALVFVALRSGYRSLRGRQGLGWGDVKLAGVAGAWLDWLTIPIALQLAALAGLAGYLLRQTALGRPISQTSRLPFGFFFAPAIWFCWLLEIRWLGPF